MKMELKFTNWYLRNVHLLFLGRWRNRRRRVEIHRPSRFPCSVTRWRVWAFVRFARLRNGSPAKRLCWENKKTPKICKFDPKYEKWVCSARLEARPNHWHKAQRLKLICARSLWLPCGYTGCADLTLCFVLRCSNVNLRRQAAHFSEYPFPSFSHFF